MAAGAANPGSQIEDDSFGQGRGSLSPSALSLHSGVPLVSSNQGLNQNRDLEVFSRERHEGGGAGTTGSVNLVAGGGPVLMGI